MVHDEAAQQAAQEAPKWHAKLTALRRHAAELVALVALALPVVF